jgi:hypothetical protein
MVELADQVRSDPKFGDADRRAFGSLLLQGSERLQEAAGLTDPGPEDDEVEDPDDDDEVEEPEEDEVEDVEDELEEPDVADEDDELEDDDEDETAAPPVGVSGKITPAKVKAMWEERQRKKAQAGTAATAKRGAANR